MNEIDVTDSQKEEMINFLLSICKIGTISLVARSLGKLQSRRQCDGLTGVGEELS